MARTSVRLKPLRIANVVTTATGNGLVANEIFIDQTKKTIGYATGTNTYELAAPAIKYFSNGNSMTFDLNNGNYFYANIPGNATMSLSNVKAGIMYYFRIRNTTATAYTLTLPNTANDIRAVDTVQIKESTSGLNYVEIAMHLDDSGMRTWQVSELLH